MSEVFLCAKNQLDDRARRELRKVGVVVVEVDDPSTCQFIRSSESMSADDMLWAAFDALKRGTSAGNARERVANNLFFLSVAARHASGAYTHEKAPE